MSLGVAARLLGTTEDAVRREVDEGTLYAVDHDGTPQVSLHSVHQALGA